MSHKKQVFNKKTICLPINRVGTKKHVFTKNYTFTSNHVLNKNKTKIDRLNWMTLYHV